MASRARPDNSHTPSRDHGGHTRATCRGYMARISEDDLRTRSRHADSWVSIWNPNGSDLLSLPLVRTPPDREVRKPRPNETYARCCHASRCPHADTATTSIRHGWAAAQRDPGTGRASADPLEHVHEDPVQHPCRRRRPR